MTSLNGKVAEYGYENLLNANYPPGDTFHVHIEGDQGLIRRGSVLAADPETMTMVLLDDDVEGTANCILAEDIDTTDIPDTETVTGLAYRTGHFNRNHIIVGDGYTLSAEDEENLRKGGILLSDSFEY